MVELKPCPFCGGEAFVTMKEAADASNNMADLVVECHECLCVVWGDFIENPDWEILQKINQAIEAWNKRA